MTLRHESSGKVADGPTIVMPAYTEISKRFDYPLHLGVTHAGPKETGTIRSVVALGGLLINGIGDTVRISYANDPIYEVEDGLELLYSLGLRERKGKAVVESTAYDIDLASIAENRHSKIFLTFEALERLRLARLLPLPPVQLLLLPLRL